MYITMATRICITMATRRSIAIDNSLLLLPKKALQPSNMWSLTTKASTYTAATIYDEKRLFPFTTILGFHGNRRHHVTKATEEDPYHSRLPDVAEIRPRQDPVVWGDDSEKAGPFSRQELQFYKTNGYIVVKGLFDAHEIKACRKTFTALRDTFEEDMESNKKEYIDTGKYVCVSEPGSTKIKSIYSTHKFLPVANQLSRDRRIVGRVQQILGRDVYIHHSRVNFQQAFKGSGFYWHSDFETWHTEDGMPRPRSMSCVVLMANNLPQNGALMVIPGSHKHYIVCKGETPENNWLGSLQDQYTGLPNHQALSQMVKEGGIHYCTGEAGSVIFFDCNLLHGSHTNISPWDRTNIFLAYNSVDNRLVAPFGPPKPRPEHICTRDPAWVQPIIPLDKPTEY
ncbi:ectoine dioxygenase-like [Branchiostoma lanceolatum]|uniref:ectoine dioxygenase-like n=1 Tax=Branchiostoma lanceolatum TaxID=7740 RepID=UPI003451D35C